jgi:deoxyribodipyrimidine photo-lyase
VCQTWRALTVPPSTSLGLLAASEDIARRWSIMRQLQMRRERRSGRSGALTSQSAKQQRSLPAMDRAAVLRFEGADRPRKRYKTMAFDVADLGPEFAKRAVALNSAPLRRDARYVLCWLQQTLRGEDHPTIDAAVILGNSLGLPVLVYHGLREDYPHASDRLHRFILGASRATSQSLQKRGIACAQHVARAGHRERGLVYRLAAHAAAVFVDEHATFVGAAQAQSFASRSDVATIAVDATRLVPFRALTGKLHATKDFRAAHTPLRAKWRSLRTQVLPTVRPYDGLLPFSADWLAAASDGDLDTLVAACKINHALCAVAEHPATAEEVTRRLDTAATMIVPAYRTRRNNAADDFSCTRLSPYLHFGLTSPWAVMDAVEAADVPPSARYKFYDELLTWREWSHWRMQATPSLANYATLPRAARATLDKHRNDPRVLVTVEDIIAGATPDVTWNACQRFWRQTGWLHNNLRMYWAKQILRWMPTPESAWEIACALNDAQSLDGRDPATYISMRWAFGEAKPGWSDNPIYGTVSARSDSAIRKREGMIELIEHWSTVTCE